MSIDPLKDHILETVGDLVTTLLHVDRLHDEHITQGTIESLVRGGSISVDEIVAAFREALEEYFPARMDPNDPQVVGRSMEHPPLSAFTSMIGCYVAIVDGTPMMVPVCNGQPDWDNYGDVDIMSCEDDDLKEIDRVFGTNFVQKRDDAVAAFKKNA